MIKIFLTHLKTPKSKIYKGKGEVLEQIIFSPLDFKTGWDFVVRWAMPGNIFIGLHTYGDDEETYILLSEGGMERIDEQTIPGDMILSQSRGRHGLVNDSANDLDFLILQTSNKPS